MNSSRRDILRGTVSSALLAVAMAAGITTPRSARASDLRQTLESLRRTNPSVSDAIHLQAPKIAVDGANVFIDFFCDLPEVDTLIVFADRNPEALVAAFWIAPQVVPALQMRIKVAETSRVWVVARSAGKFHKAAKEVTVTIGGCGAGVN